MTPSQLSRRQAAVDRHDAALARWPDRTGPAFANELKGVVSELSALAVEADASGGDALERSRTWRYLADAYFDLAQGKEASLLSQGVEAYSKAEALLSDLGQTVEEAKLNFNFANTLRGLSAGTKQPLMEEAKTRYQRAAVVFARELPQYVAQVRSALESLEAQLGFLALHEEAGATVEELSEIERALARGGAGSTPDSEKEAKRQLKAFVAQGRGIPAVQRDTVKVLESLKGIGGTAGSKPFDVAALDQMQREFTATLDASAPGGEAAVFRGLFRSLKDKYRAEVASGKVGRERQQALEPLLDELEDVLDQSPTEVADLMSTTARIRELVTRLTPLLARPSDGQEAPQPDSRAARLMEYLSAFKIFAASELNRPNLRPNEKRAATDLLTRLTRAGTDTLDAKDDEARLTTTEREVLRPLAHDLRTFGQRRHIMLATPLWASPAVTIDPNLVFFSGGASVAKAVTVVCGTRKLTLAAKSTGQNVGQSRWEDLRKAVIAVFDLSVSGLPLAAVCFEIGMAQALGTPTVILAAQAKPLPFDIEREPFELTGGNEDLRIIGEALDAGIYGITRREDGSSVSTSVAFARREFGRDGASFEVTHSLKVLDEADGDPIELRHMLQTLSGYLGARSPQLLLPAWPGAYPEPQAKRCFHVMPFRPTWANRVMKIVRDACNQTGVTYVRGDLVADPRIIRSIWDEICHASHVLVDLTDFNANVALELGMALSLGKQTLIVGQQDTVDRLFPAISKLRVHRYALTSKGKDQMTNSLVAFLQARAR
ncbi:hypothetical protein YTPLAS18_05440 [Nitrospira sp.]|nr:hypothetical protein YTPLAS18_05440 [Nitrospira sp.]